MQGFIYKGAGLNNKIVSMFKVIVCYILVNWTNFRYNHNVLNNDDFVVMSLSLLIFLLLHIVISSFHLIPDLKIFSAFKHIMTTLFCLLRKDVFMVCTLYRAS